MRVIVYAPKDEPVQVMKADSGQGVVMALRHIAASLGDSANDARYETSNYPFSYMAIYGMIPEAQGAVADWAEKYLGSRDALQFAEVLEVQK